MNSLVKEVIHDMRTGRDTWRVLLTIVSVAFLVAILVGLVQQAMIR